MKVRACKHLDFENPSDLAVDEVVKRRHTPAPEVAEVSRVEHEASGDDHLEVLHAAGGVVLDACATGPVAPPHGANLKVTR